jgi:hypothetical protein
VAAHRSDEDRWARAQHDMSGRSPDERPHDRILTRNVALSCGTSWSKGVASFHRRRQPARCLSLAPLGFNTVKRAEG